MSGACCARPRPPTPHHGPILWEPFLSVAHVGIDPWLAIRHLQTLGAIGGLKVKQVELSQGLQVEKS